MNRFQNPSKTMKIIISGKRCWSIRTITAFKTFNLAAGIQKAAYLSSLLHKSINKVYFQSSSGHLWLLKALYITWLLSSIHIHRLVAEAPSQAVIRNNRSRILIPWKCGFGSDLRGQGSNRWQCNHRLLRRPITNTTQTQNWTTLIKSVNN